METITINGVEYVQKDANTVDEGWVIIRTYSAGVHFGILKRREGKEVELTNARRLWYWSGACSLSQMAVDGVKNPEDCKFTVRVPLILLTEAIEVIPCTQKAVESLNGVPEWKS